MKIELKFDRNMRLIGKSKLGHQTIFDTVPEVGGENSAPSPMEVMLQSLAACSSMDVLSILRKKRKQIDDYWVNLTAERAENHPKVFTKVHLIYNLKSPDAELKDLERAIELSNEKYCSASAMFKAAGCIITHESNITK